jgi:DNA modification methylase
MRTVFADVRRVLRKDGTLWLNLGDSYAGGLKSKDLCGVPWRVAFALQADGWYLRQDIIWAKPNPMPESVRDRCTKSHEYLFLLSRSEKYHYDADAITEAVVADEETQRTKNKTRNEQRGKGDQDGIYHGRGDAAPFSNWKPFRNRRSVWGIATFPFSEAHFATFPPALIEPCMLAGCPKQCCAKCGAPWVRETSTEFVKLADRRPTRKAVQPNADMADINSHNVMGFNRVTTLGWSPSCSCNASTVPGTVLDPFGGAGTTGLVADRLGRNAILIELNPEYAEMAERRIRGDGGMFAQVAREPAVSSVGY